MMREEDYKECQFINTEMVFYTYEDFVENAYAIRRLYSVLRNKLFYRWYVYSHTLSLKRKDKIWEFLNNDIKYDDLLENK